MRVLFSVYLPEAEEFESIVSVGEKLDERVSPAADERSQSDLQTPASSYFLNQESSSKCDFSQRQSGLFVSSVLEINLTAATPEQNKYPSTPGENV